MLTVANMPQVADSSQTLYLHGIGHFHPENIITNDFLSELNIGTDEQWILERVGIVNRRTVLSLDYIKKTKNINLAETIDNYSLTTAQTGAAAAKMAMKRANVKPEQIGMVISGGCSPEHLIPAESAKIANELGIKATCFDINSACSSFVAQMHFICQLLTDSTADYILLVQPENNTRVINYSDRSTAVLWGDASTATVVSKKIKSNIEINHSFLDSDPSGWDKVIIPTGGHFTQIGSHVQSFAIRKSVESVKKIQQKILGHPDDLYFIGHQANLLMLNSVTQRCNINPEKHLSNVTQYGNCGAAGAPSVLSQNWNLFKKNDELVIAVVGSGLTWGGLLIRFTDLVGDAK